MTTGRAAHELCGVGGELVLDEGCRVLARGALVLGVRITPPAEDQPPVRGLLPVVVAATRVVRLVVTELGSGSVASTWPRIGVIHARQLRDESVSHPVDGDHDRGSVDVVDRLVIDVRVLDDLGARRGRVPGEAPHPEGRRERAVGGMDETAGEEAVEVCREWVEPLRLEAVLDEGVVLSAEVVALGGVGGQSQAPGAAKRVAGER